MAEILLEELKPTNASYIIGMNNVKFAKIDRFLTLAVAALPDHQQHLLARANSWRQDARRYNTEAIQFIKDVLDLLSFEEKTQEKISHQELFASAEDKVKEAGKSFSNNDTSSVMNNLNTALELVLKDKLDIPTTISKVNTARIIELLVSNRVGPYPYLAEVRKNVLDVDNKTKHQGYVPSKTDCITAIKSMEDLMMKLKTTQVAVTPQVRNAIYEGL
jgi:hypothetical protein